MYTMTSLLSRVFALFTLLSLALCATLKIQIPPSSHLLSPSLLSASTHAIITTGTSAPVRAPIRRGNFFEFAEIPTTGDHLLSIYSSTHTFAPYKINIAPGALITSISEVYLGSPWSVTGPNLLAEPTTSAAVNAKCLSKKDFYTPREGFNVLALLKNPMLLMGIVMLAFTFGMPYLMDSMPEDMKAEYEDMQKKSPVNGLTKAIQGQGGQGQAESVLGNFDLAGFLAGQQTKGATTKASGQDAAGANSIRERRR